MSEIYILDEMPILGSPPSAQHEVYLVIPSLKNHLFARRTGITIYGADFHPCWAVSVHAYKGKSAFNFWMSSLPIAILPRLLVLVLFKWLSTKVVATQGWVGNAVIVSDQKRSEIHFLVYSESLDVSLNLHLELYESSRASFKKGLDFLDEIVPH